LEIDEWAFCEQTAALLPEFIAFSIETALLRESYLEGLPMNVDWPDEHGQLMAVESSGVCLLEGVPKVAMGSLK
jgi:hypothetical protein